MDFLDSGFGIECPECGKSIRTSLRAIKNGETVSCPLGHTFQLQEDGNGIADADDGVNKLQRSIKDMERQLRRL